ncbi:MAG: transcriptional repressor LexA [Candidatus Manganitrophus sp.]|nr:transcriptional repressor LexA [Candidatus Manganitrophus sp.]WDT70761.1 MAG: transcriptional repressor LexA [Candidatus Manganitrophus sp.]
MPQPLTDRQAQVLQFITGYLADHGFPPTQREIMRRFKMKSTRGVARHLEALEKKGHLSRPHRGARALELRGATRGIPVIGKVAAGEPILATENIEGRIDLNRSLARWKDAFLLKVKGDSMIQAGILEGDYLLVKPQPGAEEGEIVIALLNGEATVKRFEKKESAFSSTPPTPLIDRSKSPRKAATSGSSERRSRSFAPWKARSAD